MKLLNMQLCVTIACLIIIGTFSNESYAQFIVAHRGASHDAPENTLAAFRLAWKQGADAIEGDFCLTLDGQIVCIHDKSTKRVAPKQPELTVAKSTLKELHQLDVGGWKAEKFVNERIPTLKEVLATVPKGKRIFVEIKCGLEIVPVLKKQLSASGLDSQQIVIISFNKAVVKECRNTIPQYKCNWLTSYKQDKEETKWKPTEMDVVASLQNSGATGLGTHSNENVIDRGFVKNIREAGFEFHVWTVNDLDTAKHFVSLGVDSITTDKPILIRNAFTSLHQTQSVDSIRELQKQAIEKGHSTAVHWGWKPEIYSFWSTHSNRLTPVYTFGTKSSEKGIDLDDYQGTNSLYRDEAKVFRLYGRPSSDSVNSQAEYLDQTNIFDIQQAALDSGKKYIFLVIFDGMDWQTTRAAAIFNQQRITYESGRGSGTHFQEYMADGTSQFGFMVTSPLNDRSRVDVDKQTVMNHGVAIYGGYDASRGGPNPWTPTNDLEYIASRSKDSTSRHAYTDSASAGSSMTSGIKTYNAAINVTNSGKHVTTIAHLAQLKGFSVGAVSSAPISHATPAAAYAHNVHRNDYQDLSRDLLGLPSISHPEQPLNGLDVLIGGGFGTERDKDNGQGENFVPGNVYLTADDLRSVNVEHGGKYVIAIRSEGVDGSKQLAKAAALARKSSRRLFGFYGHGASKGHLPFQTADGNYNPTIGRQKTAEKYLPADIIENPTLADMTSAALTVLETNKDGFWLMVEAGDVDWANHDNNLDNAIGAVNSGDDAVKVVTDWVEQHSNWKESLMIVTADHGHYLVLDRPELLIQQDQEGHEKTQEPKDR